MLIYHKDPKGLTEKELYPLDTHLSLLQNIRNRFPHGFNHQLTDIYINSEKIDPLTYDLSKKATIFDQVVIVNRQQQQLIIAVVVAIIAAVISYALAPTPKMPNSSGEQKDSSNNKLTGQTNVARLYQAKPDIFGCVRSYPDIVNPTGTEYIDNVKYVDQELTLDPQKSYRIAITNKGGYLSNWIDVISHNKDSFTADYTEAYIADNINIQMGSIFIITETISAELTEFLVTQKQYQDRIYKMQLVNYDKRIYEYDR